MREIWSRTRRFLDGLSNIERLQPELTTDNQQIELQVPTYLEDYLAYYKSCEDPGYAVLVTGDWGTGKTFQVKKALSDDERYYVSLFGLATSEDIYAAVFAEMYRVKSNVKKAVQAAEGISIGFPMLGTLGTGKLLPSIANALIKTQVKTDRTIVFDDLERCELSTKEKLGIINSYVEHYGCRVIVIAHDGKLEMDFKEAKEKLFGQTIRVEPQIDAAFAKFMNSLSDKDAQKFVGKFQKEVIEIFVASKAKSLRVLKHVIEDLARLHKELDSEYLKHDEAMEELVRLFSALNIEVRAGKISEDDLRERRKTIDMFEIARLSRTSEQEAKVPAFVDSAARYSPLDLSNTLLNDEVIVQMFIHGRYDQSEICGSLRNSSSFLKPAEAPAWKVLIQFRRVDDEIAEIAMRKLIGQFVEREITNPGEILHLFALRFMLAANGLLERSFDQVRDECKKYIDDLMAAGKLPYRGTNYNWSGSFDGGYAGFAYWVEKPFENHFNDVLAYLLSAMERALDNEFPKLAPDLLKLLESDSEAFYGQVCYSGEGPNTYAEVPILKAIEPHVFVDTWMRSHPKNWRNIRLGLKERYSGARLLNELKDEAPWLREVLILLEAKTKGVQSLRKLRIRLTIPTELQSVLEKLDKSSDKA